MVIALAIIISAVTPVMGKEAKVVRDTTENKNYRLRYGGKVGVMLHLPLQDPEEELIISSL